MRLVGCVLLLSGFVLAVATLSLLPSLPARLAFVAAALGVDLLGLALLTHGYKLARKDRA